MLSIAMNVNNFAVTQYDNFNFNSFAEYGGKTYAAGTSGIMELDDSQTDNGSSIPAFFEFWIGDSGTLNQKRIRALHFGMESNGDLQLEIVNDDGEVSNFDVSVGLTGNEQHGVRVFTSRNMLGRYWKLKIASDDGKDFSIDRIDVSWNVMAGTKQRRHLEHPIKAVLTLPVVAMESDIV